MERKRKVKATISNDSEDDYISPSENTNDNSSISNTAKQSHDNNHKFTIVMERIVALEAENACLQKHLNKEKKTASC
ncbi:unnamed protein product [Rhizophagus irregularis]|nr:unnamed protein product [Rhizophagus irregularis]